MIVILCTSRSGSTNLTNFISNCLGQPSIQSPFLKNPNGSIDDLEKGKIYKLCIHNQSKEYNHLYNFGKEIIERSEKVILLDRKNKKEQSESLVYRKVRYGDDHSQYHTKEYYDEQYLDQSRITNSVFHYSEHSTAIRQLSDTFGLPIWYYEDIFGGDDKVIQSLCDYHRIPYNQSYYIRYLHPDLKERLTRKKETLI